MHFVVFLLQCASTIIHAVRLTRAMVQKDVHAGMGPSTVSPLTMIVLMSMKIVAVATTSPSNRQPFALIDRRTVCFDMFYNDTCY